MKVDQKIRYEGEIYTIVSIRANGFVIMVTDTGKTLNIQLTDKEYTYVNN